MQWLDDLDDLCCAGVFLWGRLCRSSLGLGFCAALVLPLFGAASMGSLWLAALSATALVSVVAWTLALLFAVRPLIRTEPL